MTPARSAIDGHVQSKSAVFFTPPADVGLPFHTITFGEAFRCIDRVDITPIDVTVPGTQPLASVAFDNFDGVAHAKKS